MNYIKISYKNNRNIYNIIFLMISISITLGLILSFSIDKDLVNNIYNYFIEHINNYNNNILDNILYPILIFTFIFISSLTIIGSFMPVLALFIENISIGLLLGISLRIKALKGLIFTSIYFILTKLLYIIILIYIIINIYKFIKRFIISIKNKNNETIYSTYTKLFIKIFFSITIITIYNLICIYIIPKILNIFKYLIVWQLFVFLIWFTYQWGLNINNIRKKIIALTLAGTMIASLTGCNKLDEKLNETTKQYELTGKITKNNLKDNYYIVEIITIDDKSEL